MFSYDLTDLLAKKLEKLGKRDKILALIFRKKLLEIIEKSSDTINVYKNLKAPKNEFKRIHLTDNYILLFQVDIKKNHILFIDIAHRDHIYQ